MGLILCILEEIRYYQFWFLYLQKIREKKIDFLIPMRWLQLLIIDFTLKLAIPARTFSSWHRIQKASTKQASMQSLESKSNSFWISMYHLILWSRLRLSKYEGLRSWKVTIKTEITQFAKLFGNPWSLQNTDFECQIVIFKSTSTLQKCLCFAQSNRWHSKSQ